jgi:hypothetical protein
MIMKATTDRVSQNEHSGIVDINTRSREDDEGGNSADFEENNMERVEDDEHDPDDLRNAEKDVRVQYPGLFFPMVWESDMVHISLLRSDSSSQSPSSA